MLKLVTLSLFLALTQAWWENGHMLVAQVAEIILKQNHPNVYQRANEIVHSMDSLAYDYDNTFVTASCWPDDIKDKSMDFWDPWHFFGRPVNPNGIYLMQDVIQSESNAINALQRAQEELDESKTTEITLQKAFFLRFVLHIVGDVHQPLHSSNMFNQTFNGPNGDMGGNAETIIDIHGESMLLHSFWDQGAEYFQTSGENKIQRPFNETTQQYMENWAKELMAKYPVEYFGDLSTNLDPQVWTTESWQFAKNFTYPLIYTTNQLTKDYQDEAQEICKKRVVLGGYRLANTLISLYKDYVPPTNSNGSDKIEKHIDFHNGLGQVQQNFQKLLFSRTKKSENSKSRNDQKIIQELRKNIFKSNEN